MPQRDKLRALLSKVRRGRAVRTEDAYLLAEAALGTHEFARWRLHELVRDVYALAHAANLSLDAAEDRVAAAAGVTKDTLHDAVRGVRKGVNRRLAAAQGDFDDDQRTIERLLANDPPV